MKPTTKVDFVKEGTIVFAMNVLDKALAFLAFVYFARYFEPTAFGAAYAVIGLSALARSIPFSIGNSIRKRVSEAPDSHAAYFTLGLGLLAAYTIALYALLVPTLAHFSFRYEPLALAGLAHMAARSYLFFTQQVSQATGRISNASVVEFIDGTVTVSTKFALILGLGYGAEGLILGPTVAALLTGTGFYWYTFQHRFELPVREHLVGLYRFLRWDAIGRISYTLFSRSETALAGMFIGPASASYIKSSKTAVEPGVLPVQGIAQSTFIEVSGRSSDGLSYAETVRKGVRYAGIFSIPLLLGTLVFADRIMVAAFGTEYGGVGYVLIAAAITIVCQSYRQILLSTLQGADRPELVTYLHVVLSALFIPLYIGILSQDAFVLFVVAFASSYVVEVIGLALLTRYRVVGERIFDWRVIGTQVAAGSVMFGVLTVADSTLQIQGLFALGAAILVGAGVYFMSLLGVSPRARSLAREMLQRVPRPI